MFDALLVLNIAAGTIERIDLSDGSIRTLVDDAGAAPDGITHDADSGRIYWTIMGGPEVVGSGPDADFDFSAKNGALYSANVDGTDRREVLPVGAITTGKQLTAGFAAGQLYWGDREGCKVSRVNVDGTGLTDLVVNAPVGDIMQECVGIAVDPAAGYLYWTQKGPAKGGNGRILRAGLDIPEGETAADRTDIEVLWDNLPEPIDLHLDGDVLYWTDRGAEPSGNTLNRAAVPGPGERGAQPEVLAGGFHEAIGLAVDSAAGTAYVTDLGGTVRAVPLTAGSEERVVARIEGKLTGIVGI